MAIVALGSLISEIRGSVGGVTFSNSKSGIVAKLRVTGKISGTQKQYVKRQTLQNFNNSYRELTEVNKVLWQNYADTYTKTNMFGNNRTLSGINWYITTNYFRELSGASILTEPPTHTLPNSAPEFSISGTGGNLVIQLAVYTPGTDEKILIYITKPNNKAAVSMNSSYRFAAIEDTASEQEYNLDTDFYQINGFNFSSIESTGEFNIGVGIRLLNTSSGIAGSISRQVLKIS